MSPPNPTPPTRQPRLDPRQPDAAKPAGVDPGEIRSSDRQLLAELNAADRAVAENALAAVMERYESYCFRLAHHAIGQAADAASITTEAFFRLWNAAREQRITLDTAAVAATFRPWLSRVVLNLARSQRRQAARRGKHEQEAASRAARAESDRPGTAGADNAEQLARVRSVLDAFAPTQRDAFILHVLEGVPQRDVARILETTPDTVKTLVHRSRVALRRRLGGS